MRVQYLGWKKASVLQLYKHLKDQPHEKHLEHIAGSAISTMPNIESGSSLIAKIPVIAKKANPAAGLCHDRRLNTQPTTNMAAVIKMNPNDAAAQRPWPPPVEGFLGQIREELVTNTYRPMLARKKGNTEGWGKEGCVFLARVRNTGTSDQ